MSWEMVVMPRCAHCVGGAEHGGSAVVSGCRGWQMGEPGRSMQSERWCRAVKDRVRTLLDSWGVYSGRPRRCSHSP